MSSTENSWCCVSFGTCHTLPVSTTTADVKALTPSPYQSKIPKLKLNQSWLTYWKNAVYKKYSTVEEAIIEKILGNHLPAYPSQVACRVKTRLWHLGGRKEGMKQHPKEQLQKRNVHLLYWLNEWILLVSAMNFLCTEMCISTESTV